MNKRKLVTIRTVSKLVDIEGADNIVAAIIDGWQVVVKKNEFKQNDKCVFFEIDSFLPKEPRYEFLGKTQLYNNIEGYRLKTIKLRKTLSQGLALPLTLFPELTESVFNLPEDLSQMLNVVKYDNEQAVKKPGLKAGNAEAKFPDFIPKTDQERIQNLTSKFITSKDEIYEETLKMDGSSMTCYKIHKELRWLQKLTNMLRLTNYKPYHFGVCSRNLELKRPTKDSPKSDFWDIAIENNIEDILPVGYALQGELCGPRIQSNHEKLNENHYYIFDIYNIDKQRYLMPAERQLMFSILIRETKTMHHTQIVENGFKPFQLTLEELLERVDTQSVNKGTISEGRVYKNISNPNDTFKVINNRYLLKNEK